MKKTILKIIILISLLGNFNIGSSAQQSSSDSLIKDLIHKVEAVDKKIDAKKSNSEFEAVKSDGQSIKKDSEDLNKKEWLLIYFPIIFFLIILSATIGKLNKEKIKLKDYLIDKDVQITNNEIQVKELEATAKAISAGVKQSDLSTHSNSNNENSSQSVSRLIAFISGLTSVSIAVCICTVYFYNNFIGNLNTPLDNLSSILYGLGLGVLPYGLNKITSIFKNKE